MIKYALICEHNHEFEAWFGSSEDYETQAKRGFLSCPECGTAKVSKALMRPGVTGTKKNSEASVPMTTMPPSLSPELKAKLREFRRHVEANAEHVGDKFPEEARKIHYGEAEARGIYGKASLKEAAELAEEGVSVLPVPELPEDKN